MNRTYIRKIGMLLLPGFNSMAAHAFLDPFRAANYLSGSTLYRWEFLSIEGGAVAASNGLNVNDTRRYDATEESFQLVVINASWTPEKFNSRKLINWLKESTDNGAVPVGLDTGAFVMAQAGLLSGYHATIHYEHIAALRELFPDIIVEPDLFVIDRDRISCCGGFASADLALELVHLDFGIDLANASARYIFQDRLRSAGEGQLSPHHEPVGYTVPEPVRESIILMERNLEEPLTLPEISRYIGTSQRQLQRLFQQHTGMTPVRYYIDVRLDRARGLVTQTELPIVEVASACGFGSSEQFSRAYRLRFKTTPSLDRSEGRVPFHFRSFPGYAGV